MGTYVDAQHALAAENVLGLLCQQVSHIHVEAVLVQGPPRNDADGADIAQVMQLFPFPLGPPLLLYTPKTGSVRGVISKTCRAGNTGYEPITAPSFRAGASRTPAFLTTLVVPRAYTLLDPPYSIPLRRSRCPRHQPQAPASAGRWTQQRR